MDVIWNCSQRAYAVVTSPASYTRRGDAPSAAPLVQKAVSQVASGIKIGTVESKGPVSSLAFVIKAGSRNETVDSPGVAHFLKSSLIRSVPGDNVIRLFREIELRGNTLYTSLTREHLVVATNFLRDDLVDAVPLLVNQVFNPSFQPYEFLDAQPTVVAESAAALSDPQTQVLDRLHQVAFRTGLGNSLFANEASIGGLKRSDLQDFASKYFTADRIAIVGDGVAHEELSAIVQGALKNVTLPASFTGMKAAQQYFGGEARIEAGSGSQSLYAVAFKSVPFTSAQYPAALVLRAALDGSQRLKWGGRSGATSLLSKAATSGADVAAFEASYSDAGLLGFIVKGSADEVKGVAQRSIDALRSVSASGVDADVLSRAKKCAIIDAEAQRFSSRDVVIEDVGKQVLEKGSFGTLSEIATEISKVTADDVAKLAKVVLASRASIVGRGNLLKLPYADELKF